MGEATVVQTTIGELHHKRLDTNKIRRVGGEPTPYLL